LCFGTWSALCFALAKVAETRNGIAHPKQIPTIPCMIFAIHVSIALTPDPPKFAMYIDKSVEGARVKLITNNGGYFDRIPAMSGSHFDARHISSR